jgi:nitroreductase/dihydropteridine reductase
MQQIYGVLRNSPSSVNSQPWHFIVASTPEAKARMAKGAQGGFSYNESKILNASHVILFCVRADADQQHLDAILEQEERDGRFKDEAAKAGQAKGRLGYVNLHRYTVLPDLRKASRCYSKLPCCWIPTSPGPVSPCARTQGQRLPLHRPLR